MRVIAGSMGGRRLVAPRGWQTRPATARVRASIFSRIEARCAIADTRVLDLFAGSGSLGLEALSRGAIEAVFVDSSHTAARAIAKNLQQFGFESRARILTLEASQALAALKNQGDRFDLVFVDPPFASDLHGPVLAKLARLDLINPHGIVIVRQFHRAPELPATALERLNVATVGDHRIALYRRLITAAADRVIPNGE